MDEAEKQQAGDALMRWLEASGGESGEEMAATQEEVEEVWFAAWEACRAALTQPAEDASPGTGNPAVDEHARFRREADAAEWNRRYMRSIRGIYGQ